LAERSLDRLHTIAPVGEELAGEIEGNAAATFAEMDHYQDVRGAQLHVRAIAAHLAKTVDDGVLGALLDESGVGKSRSAAARRHGDGLSPGDHLFPGKPAHACVELRG